MSRPRQARALPLSFRHLAFILCHSHARPHDPLPGAVHPKRVPHHFTDVLIIGGGLAGLRAALAVDPQLSVLVITKDSLLQSNSNYAQGGIAGVLDPEDRFENHVADTLRAGGDLCDADVVEMVVREAPARIRELIAWGASSTKSRARWPWGAKGGTATFRIVHALGDATGREVMRAVIERVQEPAESRDLAKHLHARPADARGSVPRRAGLERVARQDAGLGQADDPLHRRRRPGLSRNDQSRGRHRRRPCPGLSRRGRTARHGIHAVPSHRAVHRRQQPQPDHRGHARRRGPAGRSQRRALHARATTTRAELAPRDVVSQAIVTQMERTRHPNVYLDLSHLDPQRVRMRFPGIAAVCAEFGIDITRDAIPVRPGRPLHDRRRHGRRRWGGRRCPACGPPAK